MGIINIPQYGKRIKFQETNPGKISSARCISLSCFSINLRIFVPSRRSTDPLQSWKKRFLRLNFISVKLFLDSVSRLRKKRR